MISFPPFRLDSEQERLWKGEALLALRKKPFAILRYLAAHPKKLVTHDELLKEIWGGAVVSDSAMRSHLHELRQVLGEGVIETVIGRGYRFVANIVAEVAAATTMDESEVDPLVVGRTTELQTLRAAFDRARAGRRQLCFVTGEPGIGKSTLVRAFLAGLDPKQVIVARGACFEQHGTPEPYLPIVDAFTALTRSDRSAQASAALVRYAPTFVSQLPQLLTDEQLALVTRRAMGGNESRQLRELCEALEALGSQDPLVLVLEDLQWSDVATIDLLSLLGQRQERAKLLVLGTSRRAEIQSPDHPLNRVLRSLVTRSGALALQLPQIDTAAVQSFLDRRFIGHDFPAQLTELVTKITGGTPLFMVSLLDELAGRGMIAERSGRWELTVSIAEVQDHRPASVKQLIDIQLDRLSAAEQRVLEAASIVGSEFSAQLVAAALEQPSEQVDDTCDALARRSLFLRAEPEGRYAVTHALIQEVCLERSSPGRRQRWHRLVAESLERDPRAGELPQLRAKHFEASDEPARAIPAYVAAARQAARRYASSDAVTLSARALDLLSRLPESRERDHLELQILSTMCQQVNANTFSASFAGRKTLDVYTRAIELARSLGDPASLYAAITELCNYHMIIAQYDLSMDLLSELDQLDRAHKLDPALRHSGIFAHAYIAFYRAELATSQRLLEQLVDQGSAEFRELPAGRVLALGHLACVHWVLGAADRALEEANETLRLAEQADSPILMALGHVVRTRLRYLRRDPLELVKADAQRAVEAAALDLGLFTEASAIALWTHAQRQPLPLRAIEPLLSGLRQRLQEVSTCSTLVGLVLVDTLRVSGHAREARELTDQMIDFANAHNESVYLPELLRVRAEQIEQSDAAAARRDYQKARELARASGARSLEERIPGG